MIELNIIGGNIPHYILGLQIDSTGNRLVTVPTIGNRVVMVGREPKEVFATLAANGLEWRLDTKRMQLHELGWAEADLDLRLRHAIEVRKRVVLDGVILSRKKVYEEVAEFTRFYRIPPLVIDDTPKVLFLGITAEQTPPWDIDPQND